MTVSSKAMWPSMTISAVAGTIRSTVSAGTTSMPSPNSAPRKWRLVGALGQRHPSDERQAGLDAEGQRDRHAACRCSAHWARMMPRCCGPGMRQASVSLPAIIMRLTDQLVQDPSGVLAMFMP